MKKNSTWLPVMFLFPVISFCQNVGVGTATPSEKLEVAGNIKADTLKLNSFKLGMSAGAGNVLTSDINGIGGWHPAPGILRALNGLYRAGDSVRLGGPMVENSSIRLNARSLVITDTGSIVSLAIDQPGMSLATALTGVPLTQTFIAGANATLTRVEIYIDAFAGSSISMQVKDASGASLAIVTNNYPATQSNWSSFNFGHVLMTSVNEYTLSITSTGTTQLRYENSDPYPNGSSSIGVATDIAFKVFDTGEKNLLFLKGNRVGINTTDPMAAIDIAGTFRLNDGSQGAGKLMVSDGNGLGKWQTITSNSLGGWGVNGNTGMTASNFIGTIDSIPFALKVNNQQAARIDMSFGGNSFFGLRAGYYNTAGGNTGMGYRSLHFNTTGLFNSAHGYEALYSNTEGIHNTASGYLSLYSNTTGIVNTGIGSWALTDNTIGRGNTATGAYSLHHNSTGEFNTASGYHSLYNNYTAIYNTAFGAFALSAAVNSFNTAIGAYALSNTSSAQNNVGIGYRSGDTYNMGFNNTIIGAEADVSFINLYNSIAIGNLAVTTDNSKVRIGNSVNWSYEAFANWTNISDGRYKKNIRENVSGLDFIMRLKPVTYQMDVKGLVSKFGEDKREDNDGSMKTGIAEKEAMIWTGFIAQDVEAAAKEAGFEFSGVDKPRNDHGVYGLRYAEFVVPLVKAMQEQQKQIEELKAEIERLKIK